MKTRKTIAVALMAGVILAGCASRVPPPPPPPPKLVDDSHPRATLILGSAALAGNVELANVRVGQVGALPRAAVDIRNLTDWRHVLEYRFVWFDRDGFPVQEDMAMWHRVVLTPHRVETVTSQAKAPEAYKFRLTVRLPDDDLKEYGEKIQREMLQ